MDQRWYRLADILVTHSAKVKKGENVMIAMHETHTEDLVTALCQKVIQKGAYPQVQFFSEKIRSKLLQYGNKEQLTHIPDIEAYGMEWADVYFGIRGAFNLGESGIVTDENRVLNQEINGKISKMRWEKTRWCLIKVPNVEMAALAQIPFEELQDDFFDSCFIDWSSKLQEWNALKTYLEKGKFVRIVSKNTDLSFSTEGRKWILFDGKMNLPDGEIATAPITDTICGSIEFNQPAVLGGQIFNDVVLRWDQGKLIESYSSNNKELLKKIVNTDAGASLIGEFAFGLNDGLKKNCNDILLDEKIGGTLHIALGRAYKDCLGTNESSIHWDMVLDSRIDTEVYLDDILIFKNGFFLI